MAALQETLSVFWKMTKIKQIESGRGQKVKSRMPARPAKMPTYEYII
jgi:hypothetical protein